MCLQDFKCTECFRCACCLSFVCLQPVGLDFSLPSLDPSLLDAVFIWISVILMNTLWISWIPGPGALFHPVWSLLSLLLLSLVNKSDKSSCPGVQLSNGTSSILLFSLSFHELLLWGFFKLGVFFNFILCEIILFTGSCCCWEWDRELLPTSFSLSVGRDWCHTPINR